MAKHRATEAPADPAPSPSPLSGSLYITVCEVRFNGVGEWRQLLIPNMQESEAERMADYLDTYIAPEGGYVVEYRNVRIAHCMFSELPDMSEEPPGCLEANEGPFVPPYNDTDPLT